MNLINKRRGDHCFGHPIQGATQVEKSPRSNLAIQISRLHTMVHVPLMILIEWREFPSASCFAGKKNDDSSRLHAVETARVA